MVAAFSVRQTRLWIGLLGCLSALSGYSPDASSQQSYSNDIQARIEQANRPQSGSASASGSLPSLREIYAPRNFAPLWIGGTAPTAQAIALIRVLCSAETYGLRSAEYLNCTGFEHLLTGPAPGEPSPPVDAEFDIGLTTGAMRFLQHVHFGRIEPRQAGFDLGFARPPLPYGPMLVELSTASDIVAVIARIEPQLEHYALLKQALARYQLLATGQAVPTRAELQSAPYEGRIRQIELTLERWRWLPAFQTPPIIVNIPQFRLFAFDSTQDLKAQMLQMDVIVGGTFPKLRTPVFAADLKYVIFRPYWDVPYDIAQKEMLPKLRRNPDFGEKQHLELVHGPEDRARVVPFSAANLKLLAAGKLRLRQRPGPDNALGLIKFMLPNSYNVYLHSTPAHGLFNRAHRAFSHGCIRVSDPVALADHVLRNAAETWTPAAITAAMNGSDTFRVDLKTPIQVLILYATAFATEGGAVQFFDDIYGYDRRLARQLGLPQLTANRRH